MNSYLIESLAPLVFRSGKPFGSQSSAQDVIFPLPSAGAGLVRALAIGQGQLTSDNSRLQYDDKEDEFSNSHHQNTILATQSQGVYLVAYNDSKTLDADNIIIFVPKPTNALYFENKDNKDENGKPIVKLVRLSPQPFDGVCGSDLPDNLLPVQMEQEIKGKPYKKGAVYWSLEDVKKWQNNEPLTFDQVNDNGLPSLPIDIRTHVSIDDTTLASEDGKLFQTASFDLVHKKKENAKLSDKEVWSSQRFGFLLQSSQKLNDDLATFGGERRLSYFKEVKVSPLYEYKQDKLAQRLQQIKEKGGFSLTFLTPCIFKQGYLPRWIDKDSMQGTLTLDNAEIKLQLKAVAIDRWQGVSGWDSILWKPKATRKAVATGSVYWFQLTNPEQLTSDILQSLEQKIWSDNDQDHNDGFGVALLSAWQVAKN